MEDEGVESADAVNIPPEADALTDNEDIDDDCTEDVEIADVAGTLELQLTIEVVRSKWCYLSGIPSWSIAKTTKEKRKLFSTVPTWRYKQPEYTKVYDRSEAYENNLMKIKDQLKGSTPFKVFEEIFSEEIVQLIIKESVRYATETIEQACNYS